jgi:CMP-N,N'-diacetyllegionaminic acid synthase
LHFCPPNPPYLPYLPDLPYSVVIVLGVITARGGSKGIPGKNLKPLVGRPLIDYTVEAARASDVFDRVIVSTDDAEIASHARTRGCDVPFLRPAELAGDDTPHLPVMQHAVDWLAEHQAYRPDAVVILQPTSPLRRAEDVREAVHLLEQSDADSVVSVTEVPAHMNPMRMLRVDNRGRATLFVTGEPVRRRINRRQDMPPAWVMNGAVYAFRARVLYADEPSLYGTSTLAMPMPEPFGLSIDTPEDWSEAEKVIRCHHGS